MTRQRNFERLASTVQDAGKRGAPGLEVLAEILEQLTIIIRSEASAGYGEPDIWLIYALAEIAHDLPKEIPYLTAAESCESYVEAFLEKLTYWKDWLESNHP
jgi:hypothetical protein